MFERYTEKARRVIFFARYEASNLGCIGIDTEHLLLGLAREDLPLLQQGVGADITDVLFREQIEAQKGVRKKTPTARDIPLSDASKRALAFAAMEADALCSPSIGTEHLLLGLARVEKSFAVTLLRANGFQVERLHSTTSLTPRQQQAWRRSRIRINTAYTLAGFVQKALLLLLFWLFVQVTWKAWVHDLKPFDIRFYAISLPVLLCFNLAALFILRRSGRMLQRKLARYLTAVIALFAAAMGMIVGAR